jgi:GH24 family phage-related lysozyme (muramidase)
MNTHTRGTRNAKRVLVLAVLAAALAAPAWAADGDYEFDAAAGTIKKYTGWDTELTIPASIGGKPVQAIGESAFEKAGLTAVTIPAGVTSIGSGAFAGNKLTGVTIPGSVTLIDRAAFGGNQLTEVVIPEGVEEIGSGAFSGNKLVSISLPSTLRRMVNNIYGEYGRAPATVILAANINAVSKESFGYAVYYNYIANDRKAGTYTQSMAYAKKTAEDFTYYETQYGAVITRWEGDATRVRVPAELGGAPVKGLYSDSDGVFNRKRLVAVQLPDTLSFIGRDSFSYNELSSVTFPSGLTYIEDYAFSSNKIAALTIPAGVTYIGMGAFSNNSLTALSIPGSVKIIGTNAFGFNALASLTIERGVTRIELSAFEGNKLTSLTIPASVAYIGEGAFSTSTDAKLSAVTITAGVTYIGKNAFSIIKPSVTIPATVTRMGGIPVSGDVGCAFVIQKDVELEEEVFVSYGKTKTLKAGRYTYTRDSWGAYVWQHSAR